MMGGKSGQRIAAYFSFMVLIVAVAVMLVCFWRESEISVSDSSGAHLSDWLVESSDSSELIEAPFSVQASPYEDKPVTASSALPEKIDDDDWMYLSTNFQAMSIRIDGQPVVETTGSRLFPKLGDQFFGFALAPGMAGKTVEISFLGHGSNGRICLYDVIVGAKDAIRFRLLLSSWYKLVISMLLLSMCMILVIGILIARRRIADESMTGFVHLTLFIFCTAAWIMEDTSFPTAWLNGGSLHLFFNILVYLALPIPLVAYLRSFHHMKGKAFRYLRISSCLPLAFFLLTLLLGVFRLDVTLAFSHIVLVAMFSYVILLYARRMKGNSAFSSKGIFYGLVFLFICDLADMVCFYFIFKGVNSNSIFSVIGMLALNIIMLSESFRNGLHIVSSSTTFTELNKNVLCGICRISADDSHSLIYANPYFHKMFGYNSDAFKFTRETSFFFNVFPRDVPVFKAEIDNMIRNKEELWQCEHRFFKQDGSIIWVLCRLSYDPMMPDKGITIVFFDISDRKEKEELQRFRETAYRIASEHSDKMIVRYDIETDHASLQNQTAEFLGLPMEIDDFSKQIIKTGLIARESVDNCRRFHDEIRAGKLNVSAQLSMMNKAAHQYRWFQFDSTTVTDDEDYPVQAIISFFDINAQHEKELAFQRWQQTYEDIPKHQMCYIALDLTEDTIEQHEGLLFPQIPGLMNGGIEDYADTLAKHNVFPEDREAFLDFLSKDRLIQNYGNARKEDKTAFRRIGDDDRPCWTSVSVQIIPDPYSSAIKCYILFQDIDEEKQAELLLRKKSTYDSETGLLRREAFIEEFERRAKDSDRIGEINAFLILDVDDFKSFNDMFGHQAGDEVLRIYAGKLKMNLRDNDLCGRLGGDEFVVCMFNMHSANSFDSRLNTLREQLFFRFKDRDVHCSIGAVLFGSDGNNSFDALYQNADSALYYAKYHGKNSHKIFNF